jgi:hypothetical protein
VAIPHASYRNITHKTISRIELTLEEDGEYRNIDFRKLIGKESMIPGRKLDFEKNKNTRIKKRNKKESKILKKRKKNWTNNGKWREIKNKHEILLITDTNK